MPRALSQDLRDRVIDAVLFKGQTRRGAANLFFNRAAHDATGAGNIGDYHIPEQLEQLPLATDRDSPRECDDHSGRDGQYAYRCFGGFGAALRPGNGGGGVDQHTHRGHFFDCSKILHRRNCEWKFEIMPRQTEIYSQTQG